MSVSQSELGKQLNSSAMAVSRWERGVQEPPANIYIQLGNITGDPECWYFWGRAGLHSGDLMRVLPAVRSRLQKERLPDLQVVQAGAHRLRKKGSHLVAIPVLPVVAATQGGKGDPEVALDDARAPRRLYRRGGQISKQPPQAVRTNRGGSPQGTGFDCVETAAL